MNGSLGKRIRRAGFNGALPRFHRIMAGIFGSLLLVGGIPSALAFEPAASPEGYRLVQGASPEAGQLPSLAEVAKKAMPAVVNISTTQKEETRRMRPSPPMPGPNPFGHEDPLEEFFRRFFGERLPPRQQRSLGSGFIISADGYIITNDHVIGQASKITVRLSDKEEYTAKVIGRDEKTDLALIKIAANRSLPTLPLGNSAALQVADWVMAIGNPFGLEQTVTVGIVSAKARVIGAGAYDDFIQTDASINPGNSGGPLLNIQGEVVGINSAIFSQGGGNIGIGFAIPVDLAKSIVEQLRQTGKVTRGWLGVSIQTVTPELAKSFGLTEPRGALVAEVTPQGPAEKAGLQRGDVITAFAGTTIEDSHELPTLVAQTAVGKTVEVTVLREGKERTFSVTLGQLPEQQAQAEGGETGEEKWGLTVADISVETTRRFQLAPGQQGVVVIAVEPGSQADIADLRPGDVIEEVNQQTVTSVQEFNRAVTQEAKQEILLLLVRRGENSSYVTLRNQE